MAILWCGGEDIDFNGTGFMPAHVGNYYRTSYARVSFYALSTDSEATGTFTPVTSAWLSFRAYASGTANNVKQIGLKRSGKNSGVFVGRGSVYTKFAFWKLDNGVWTNLSEITFVPPANQKIDLQIVNLGASCTLNAYMDGTLIHTWSGSLTFSDGTTDLDRVMLPFTGSGCWYMSEVIVANEDTRLFSLSTLAPTSDTGETVASANQWTGDYTTVDEVTASDADVAYSDVTGQNFQSNLSNLTAGQFVVKGVKVAARMSRSPTGVSSAKLGVKTNGSVDVAAQVTLDTAWSSQERMLVVNPVTGTTWTPTEIKDLILDIQTGT